MMHKCCCDTQTHTTLGYVRRSERFRGQMKNKHLFADFIRNGFNRVTPAMPQDDAFYFRLVQYRNKQIWIGCCCDTGSWLIDHIHNHFAVVTCPLYSGKNDWQWHAQDLKPCISRQSQRSWGINCFNLSLETLQSISEPEMCCGQHISRRMTWQPRGYWASPWRWEIHNIKLSCKPDKMISTSEWIKYLELVNNWFTHCPDLVGGKLDCSWA